MTIPLIKARIQAQQALFITQNGGVGTAFRYIPREITNVELPAFITRTDSAEYENYAYGAESFQEARVFLMEFYVANLAHGEEGDAEELCETWIKPVQDFWAARQRLELNGSDPLDGIQQSILLGDAGIKAARFPIDPAAALYAVVQFRLSVTWERQVNLL